MSYDSLLGGAVGSLIKSPGGQNWVVDGVAKGKETFGQKIKLFWANHKTLVIGGGVAILLVVLVLAWGGGGKGKKGGKKGKKGGKKKGKKGKKSGFLPFQNQSASIL